MSETNRINRAISYCQTARDEFPKPEAVVYIYKAVNALENQETEAEQTARLELDKTTTHIGNSNYFSAGVALGRAIENLTQVTDE